MLVKDIMQKPAVTCAANDSLNRAAQLMWENDCGALPVVDAQGCIVGMITDRDALMGAYTRGGPLSASSVSDAMSTTVLSCRGGDPVEAAERLMAESQIRRVPVVDEQLRPLGMLSLNDLARDVARRKRDGLDREFVRTMAAVCTPRPRATARAHAAE